MRICQGAMSNKKSKGQQARVRKTKKEEDEGRQYLWIAGIALGVALLHNAHLHTLFENDRYFSHLSTLERELSFRTEMGLYYSYFKTIATAPSFFNGLEQILYDNLTEYPSTINTLQRFNLYPEVVLGGVYRTWQAMLTLVGSTGVECFQISRGYGQPPISACNGLGDHAYFYVSCVFMWNGLMAGMIFALGSYLSDNLWGGLISTVFFIFNHGEATRVMWTPPLRESFAMPLLLLQMLVLTYCIRHHSPSFFHYCGLAIASLSFLLPWQFSQFVLVTQTFSLFMLHSLRLLPSSRLSALYSCLAAALLANMILQFFNSLLLTSLFPPSLFSCLLILNLQHLYDYIPWTTMRICAEVASALLLMVCFKVLLTLVVGGVDDAHIAAIFMSKITSYQDFHTQLYTCSPEFDFLPMDYPLQLLVTLLIPTACLAILIITVAIFRHLYSSHSTVCLAEQAYFLIQCLAFLLLAVLIMRLKLFLTPQLCLVSAFLARSKFQSVMSPHLLVCVLLFGGSFKGVYNLWHQWSIEGEFNDPQLEELVAWVNSVPPHAVFAGAMPTMAALRLSTPHAIVNHPHYEDAGLRRRTLEVYTIYSRKPPEEIRSKLSELLVTHVVVEEPWCKKRYRPGCSFAEVWDELDPVNQDRPQFCHLIKETVPEGFEQAFANSIYRVLKLV